MDTRRRGAFLMIIGANLIAAAIAMGVYVASVACVMLNDDCAAGLLTLFFSLMTSIEGLLLWAVIALGALVFWWGRRIRSHS